PYRESAWRHLVYNKRNRQVVRIDEIGDSCLELPEDHGIVFPGGYYLESGESKHFAELGHDFAGFRLKRQIRAPSGEDVLYVFHEELSGRYALLPYNLIDRSIGSPLLANGYARFDDGRLLLFTPELDEPARLHTMQLWSSPFCSDEHAAAQVRPEGLLGRLGNAVLVRGLAELRQLARLAEDADTRPAYERLIRLAARSRDAYPWLAEAEAGALHEPLQEIHKAADAALQAYERLEVQRAQARQAVDHAAGEVRELLSQTESLLWQQPDDFTRAIAALKRRRGELVGLAEQPHVDEQAIAQLDGQLQDTLRRVGDRAIKFFSDPAAFADLRSGLEQLSSEVEQAATSAALRPLAEQLDELAESLDGLSELIAGFEQTDAQARAELLAATSGLYADVNRLRSRLKQRSEGLVETEQGLEFGAQLTVLEQSLQHQLARCDTPEAADEGLARAISQIETLEGRFATQPRFAEELVQRRETVLEAFAARREQLQAERNRRTSALRVAVERILDGVPRRVGRLTDGEAIHAFFAADTLVERARHQIDQLRELGENVAADELASRLQALKEAGLRDARDRAELGTSGDSLALGAQRFSIERQALEPVLLPGPEALQLQLAGTDYRRQLQWPEAERFREVWTQLLVSENADVYR
ncbi:MAG: DNA repair ATPase, partial [Xanthomonadales bacterium]|nr:DNA repair ATPase [Xanthomonadales bacterium]